MTSLSLALQMEHDLRDELWNYSSRPEHFYITFYNDTTTCDTFLHILQICILQTIQTELTKKISMTDHGNYDLQCTEPGLS